SPGGASTKKTATKPRMTLAATLPAKNKNRAKKILPVILAAPINPLPVMLMSDPFNRQNKARERLLQDRSRTSAIDAQKACSFLAEYGPFGKRHFRLHVHQLLQLLAVKSKL